MIKKQGRDQSQKRKENRERVWKALRRAELKAFDEGRSSVRIADFKKDLKISRPTIYKVLRDLETRKQISRPEPGRYSSKQFELVMKITKGLLNRDYHEEGISMRERDRSISINYDDLELLSSPYKRIQDEIKSLEKNRLKSLLYVQRLTKLYGLKGWVESKANDEFRPILNLVRDATNISILSDSFLYPFPRSTHELPKDMEKKAVDVYLDGLRDEVWKMLLLYTIHHNFSLDNSALAIVITFDPHDVILKDEWNDLRTRLANIDHSGFAEFYLDMLRQNRYPKS